MSPRRSDRRQPAGAGPGTARPTAGAKAMRTGTLVVLLCVVVIVTVLQVASLVDFVISPDPEVRAGPMYVTLGLTTGCALLMLLMSLNATFLPFVPRRRAPDLYLVTAALGVTGVVTGLLTVGGEANSIVTRLILGAMAFLFIVMQDMRLQQARAARRPEHAAAHPQPTAPRGAQALTGLAHGVC